MTRSVLIVGSGPAGLTAALRLQAADFQVTVIDEGAAQVQLPLVILGADQATIDLLSLLGTAGHASFPRSLHYRFFTPSKRVAKLSRPLAPARLRPVMSLATFPLLSLRDRRRLLSFLERTWEGDPPLALDLENRSAEQWLQHIGQSAEARQLVWAPFARFFLGDEPASVSAGQFAGTMSRCFLSSARSARLSLPSHGLEQLLIGPATRRLRRDQIVHSPAAAIDLQVDRRRIRRVATADGRTFSADWYVMAVPHDRLMALLPEDILTRFGYFQQLGGLRDLPGLAVQLRVADPLPSPRLFLLGPHLYHWMTCRPVMEGRRPSSLISFVATGSTLPDHVSAGFLEQTAIELMTQAFGLKARPAIVQVEIHRVPRACLSLKPGTAALRPLQQSPLTDLFIAGAWTDTGLPATLESAIVSGHRCADAILTASAHPR